MARLRKFDIYAADFARELQDVLSRYCRGVDADPDSGTGREIDIELKSGESLTVFFERGTLWVLYRGTYYRTRDLPRDDTNDTRGAEE